MDRRWPRVARLLLGLTALVSLPAVGDSQDASGEKRSEPFGLYMGMSRADISKVGDLEPRERANTYTMTSVPKPHPKFESYLLVVTQGEGLCKLVAVGKTIETSAYGTALKRLFEGIEESLASKYGEHFTADFLSSGSIWNEPRDYMMGLLKKERFLSAYWDDEEKSKIPGDIQAIVLHARALGRDSGYLSLAYEFANFRQCSDAMKADEADVF